MESEMFKKVENEMFSVLISKDVCLKGVCPLKPCPCAALLARTAIQAMREPSAEMIQAGINEGDHKPGNWYPAMIDAALSGKSGMGEG